MIFVADIVITVLTVLKMNKQLERMEDIQKSILKISDEMSEIIGSGTIKTMDNILLISSNIFASYQKARGNPPGYNKFITSIS